MTSMTLGTPQKGTSSNYNSGTYGTSLYGPQQAKTVNTAAPLGNVNTSGTIDGANTRMTLTSE